MGGPPDIRDRPPGSSLVIPQWYHLSLVAMTLRLSESETEALRRQTEIEDRSMPDIVRRSITEYLARHGRAVGREALLREAVDEHRDLLDRLRHS